MKSMLSSRPTKGITVGTILNCIDNSGAKLLKVIGVLGYKGRRNRYPKAGIGDVVVCSVIAGSPKIRKQIVKALIVRQKMPYVRKDGTVIRFDDNAAIVITDSFDLKGSEIKGVIAKEIEEKFPSKMFASKSLGVI